MKTQGRYEKPTVQTLGADQIVEMLGPVQAYPGQGSGGGAASDVMRAFEPGSRTFDKR